MDDFEGSVIQVDPGERRVVTRLEMPGAPQAVAAGAGSVWVQTEGRRCGDGRLVRIDPSSGRVVLRAPLPYPEDGNLTVAGGGVWVTEGCHPNQTLDRRDDSATSTASVTLGRVAALAAAEGNLWVLSRDGTLTQLDPVTGHILHRRTGLGLFMGGEASSTNSLVADSSGVWLLSPTRAAILHIQDGQVVQQIAVDASAQPVLAKARDGLWIATGDRLGAHNRLIRIDPASGKPTGTVDLGIQRPVALMPTDDQLCVLTANGKILFVES